MGSTQLFSNVSANRYANALYELAEEESELIKVEEEILGLNMLIKTCKDFKNTISDPTVDKNEKKKAIMLIADSYNFSKISKKFLSYLIFKRRLYYLQKIIENFLNILSLKKGEVQAKLLSAKKLNVDEIEKIQNELSENYSSKIKLTYNHRPDLLGGLIIQVGSVMIDASLKTKLNRLKNKMIEE